MGIKGFEERLGRARKEKGYTQEELANRLGVTPQAVSKWERGVGLPDIETLFYICEILDCSSDYLLHRDLPEDKLFETKDEKRERQLLMKILAEPLVIVAGMGLVPLLVEEHKKQFENIQIIRNNLANQLGILLPLVRIRDDDTLDELEYRILAYDKVLYAHKDKDHDITFQDICNRLEEVCLDHYGDILNRQMVKTLVDNVADRYPAVVDGVVPQKISLSLLQKVMIQMVARKCSIHNMVKIIELLEEEIEYTQDINHITDNIIAKL